jgi:hypothetical protein
MIHDVALSLIRRTTSISFAIVFALVVFPSVAVAQPPSFGAAETFAVLAGTSVTNTGATSVSGDVGVGDGGSITGTAITVDADHAIHEGDAVAVQALLDATEAFEDLDELTCTSNLSGQNLGGMSLGPGTYCFNGDATLSGSALTLTGAGPWVFKIAGGLATTASVTVSGSTQACDGSSVFWRVGDDATIGAGTEFVGSLVAQAGVGLGTGATVDGRIISIDSPSTVALDANTVTACSFGNLLPVHAPIKVTGGGQINVPDPDSFTTASYGFNAKPETSGGGSGHLNYVNPVTGLHVNGTVTDVEVVTINPDGSPKMVRFSGTCKDGSSCTFSVTVEDNGEPSIDDRFGITVIGSSADETTADRVVRNGNIQFHLSLTTTLNARSFGPGEVMAVSVSLTPGLSPPRVDAYLVLQLPDGQFVSWTAQGPVVGIVPLARNVMPVNFRSVIAAISIPHGIPLGTYTWLSALTATGTMNLVSEIAAQRFVIEP